MAIDLQTAKAMAVQWHADGAIPLNSDNPALITFLYCLVGILTGLAIAELVKKTRVLHWLKFVTVDVLYKTFSDAYKALFYRKIDEYECNLVSVSNLTNHNEGNKFRRLLPDKYEISFTVPQGTHAMMASVKFRGRNTLVAQAIFLRSYTGIEATNIDVYPVCIRRLRLLTAYRNRVLMLLRRLHIAPEILTHLINKSNVCRYELDFRTKDENRRIRERTEYNQQKQEVAKQGLHTFMYGQKVINKKLPDRRWRDSLIIDARPSDLLTMDEPDINQLLSPLGPTTDIVASGEFNQQQSLGNISVSGIFIQTPTEARPGVADDMRVWVDLNSGLICRIDLFNIRTFITVYEQRVPGDARVEIYDRDTIVSYTASRPAHRISSYNEEVIQYGVQNYLITLNDGRQFST
jgi:hypothetical protein